MGEPEEIELTDSDLIVSPVRRGRRLGRYVLCYELASGGMATVYLGRASGAAGFQKLVAIKIIHPHLAKEPDFVEMFLDEARIASGIDHPNVCSAFDFGEADGTYFLAMEYLVGETAARLARTLAKNPQAGPPKQLPSIIAYIFQQACEGLHAAHELKGPDGQYLEVVHRDMTPHNLFVGYDGSVRVVDFGVASAVGRMHETNTGTLKGKFAYMSPEQARQKKLDRRSDIWSLGVSLWEMLTRRRLFRREGEYETLEAVVQGEIPAPSSVRPQIPPALDAIVMRALERDRDKRYATARQMGRELGRFVSTSGGASSADLADLMDGLYAEERKKRRSLLEEARRMDPDTPSQSKVRPAPVLSLEGESGTASMPSQTIVDHAAKRRRRRLFLMGFVAAAAVGVVVLALFFAASPDEPSAVVANANANVNPTPTPTPTPAPPPAMDSPREPPDDPESAAADPEIAPDDPPTPELPLAEPGPVATTMMARRRPPAAMTAGRGRLHIATPPGWADVYVDGRNVGRSPTEVRLNEGSRRIRLMPYGEGPPINRRVNIDADGTSRLVVRLPN